MQTIGEWWHNKFKDGTPAGVFLAGGIIVLVLIFTILAIVKYNQFVDYESGIAAENRKMENALGVGYKKIQSQGLVVDKYKTIFLKAIEVSMKGRYGKTGSIAGMQWIQEAHPNLSPSVFRALTNAIEAMFNRFQAAQLAKIDRVRAYEKSLDSFPGNVFAGIFGFPKKIDLKKERQVVSSPAAKKSMKSKHLTNPRF
jgi:LemA protein